MLTAALPLFRLKGKTYSLEDHFFFEPLFNIHIPRRTLFKCARQVGKCVALSDIRKIRKANGSPLEPYELVPGTELLSLDDDLRLVPRAIKHVESNGTKPLLRITTRLGSSFKITTNHPLLTPDGYVKAADLKKGTRLAGIRSGGVFRDKYVDFRRIITTAYMLGDGNCSDPNQPELTLKEDNHAIFEDIGSLFVEGSDFSIYRSKERVPRIYWKARCVVRQWLREDGLIDKHSWEKSVPTWVFDVDKPSMALFLGRLWATDGTCTSQSDGPDISYTSTSPELATSVSVLLNKLGILCSRKLRKTDGRPAWVVRVEGRESQRTFVETIHVPGKPPIHVKEGFNENNRDTIPVQFSHVFQGLFSSTKNKHDTSLRSKGFRQIKPLHSMSRKKADDYLKAAEELNLQNVPEYRHLDNLINGDLTWDVITDVTPCESEETFDLEMGEEHNFVLDGIVSHNTQNMTVAKLSKTIALPYYNSLFVCPRFEQIKRISNNYMRPLIEESPVKNLFVREGSARDQSILQRTFKNGSTHFYSFAFLDAERIRSVSCSDVNLDEVQDIQWEFIPVIAETMSGSKRWRNQLYTGTAKTVDNTIQLLWQDSSQAEWGIECKACNYWNLACMDHDLIKMIGKKGPVCAKCGRGIEPRHGGWVHAFPDRQGVFVGFHIPQTVHPFHYETEANWQDLLYKMHSYPEYLFMNECLGESFDSGIKLMTLKDLRRLSCLGPNTLHHAANHRRDYESVAMGIDWGGGGHESQSYTSVVIAGIRPGNDVIEVLYHEKLSRTLPPEHETLWLLDLFQKFNPQFMAHDYGGAGNLRELMMIQAGVPLAKIVPYTYVASAKKPVITFDATKTSGTRSSYSLDKARSLVTLCTMMKAGKVLLPLRQERDENDAMNDLLNLTEDRQERPRGSDIVMVSKTAGSSDDTAHALNYACSCLWYSTRGYPDLAEALRIKLSQVDLSQISPNTIQLSDWREPDE